MKRWELRNLRRVSDGATSWNETFALDNDKQLYVFITWSDFLFILKKKKKEAFNGEKNTGTRTKHSRTQEQNQPGFVSCFSLIIHQMQCRLT